MMPWRRLGVALAGLGLAALVLPACSAGVTGSASEVSDVLATLHGVVHNTKAEATEFWFEYGVSTAYGTSTAHGSVTIFTPGQGVDVAARIEELAEGTTYHFRLCTAAADGGVCGADATFTTTHGFDAVWGSGVDLDLGFGYVYGAEVFATSKPRGRAPATGTASTSPGSYYFKIPDTGAVTCLRVKGNRAAIGFVAEPVDLGQDPPIEPVPLMIFIEDNGPSGDRLQLATLSDPATTCPVPSASDFVGFLLGSILVPPAVATGDFTIHDHLPG